MSKGSGCIGFAGAVVVGLVIGVMALAVAGGLALGQHPGAGR